VLKIETIRKKAEVFFSDGSRLYGDFFASPNSLIHTGHERISELLNSERAYLPFILQDGNVVLLQKGAITRVVLDENEMNRELPYLKENAAHVELLTGEILEGKVYLDLPETHFRLSDFLNVNRGFFYLHVNNRVTLVNSRFVKWVRNP
jgi:hypothetical protein